MRAVITLTDTDGKDGINLKLNYTSKGKRQGMSEDSAAHRAATLMMGFLAQTLKAAQTKPKPKGE